MMRDQEVIDIIEHYRWGVSPQQNGGWVIEGSSPTGGDDAEVVELARTRGNLRAAVLMALRAQAGQ
jgi:hypothetical protein